MFSYLRGRRFRNLPSTYEIVKHRKKATSNTRFFLCDQNDPHPFPWCLIMAWLLSKRANNGMPHSEPSDPLSHQIDVRLEYPVDLGEAVAI
jgi:hypothetical protein